jgi:hypothetical protein
MIRTTFICDRCNQEMKIPGAYIREKKTGMALEICESCWYLMWDLIEKEEESDSVPGTTLASCGDNPAVI